MDTDSASSVTVRSVTGVVLMGAGWGLVLSSAGFGLYALARFDYSGKGAIPTTLMFLLYMAVPIGIGWLSIRWGRHLRRLRAAT